MRIKPMAEVILENKMIEQIANHFAKPPHRINRIHEADAELIDFEGDYCLAVTTDAVVEEIASGMYDDPYLMGWMLATVNFSDLAAVGADPLGLVISVNYPSDRDESFIRRLSEGISDACQAVNSFVLGGDTNQSEELFLSGCAVGTVPKNYVITRMGAKPGDLCYLSAPAGMGSIFALLKLLGKGTMSDSSYQPTARLKEGKIIRKYASCCMDTSDGVIHTLDTLMRLNCCQFVLNDNWEKILHPTVLQVFKAQNLPLWLSLAGVHGEFELLFTINPWNEENFLREAEKNGWAPILIGNVVDGEGVSIRTAKQLVPVNTALIRNLSEIAGSDSQGYIKGLIDYAVKLAL
jgi:thiamine-monophosphate kinase